MRRTDSNTSARGRPRRVDWAAVDKELRRVPADYKNPKFDSLKHVLTVLSAVDSEGALGEVRLRPRTSSGTCPAPSTYRLSRVRFTYAGSIAARKQRC